MLCITLSESQYIYVVNKSQFIHLQHDLAAVIFTVVHVFLYTVWLVFRLLL